MKEIQSKIKFGIAEIRNGICNIEICDNRERYILSKITEKQAAEFVAPKTIWKDKEFRVVPVTTISPKESLISLLKANDVCIKDWCVQPNASFTLKEDDLYDKLPDDLLLIKL